LKKEGIFSIVELEFRISGDFDEDASGIAKFRGDGDDM
jgi:hypothetical protein